MNKKYKKYNTLGVIITCILAILFGYMLYEKILVSSNQKNISEVPSNNNISQQTPLGYNDLEHTTETSITNIQSQYPQNDNSIFKYISPVIAFDEVEYIPKGLIKIEPSRAISFSKTMQIREDVLPFFQEMSEAFFTKFKKPIHIVSAYRSYEYQVRIEKNNPQCIVSLFCFEASDKDIFMKNSTYALYYYWLKDNAHKYGFIQSYQKGKEIDGYNIEPWHWRYIGKELASELHKKDMTFSEWYKQYFEDKVYAPKK